MTRVFAILLGVLTLGLTGVARAEPVNTGHLVAELVAQQESIVPGGKVHLALRQKIQKDWHTYWRNSGDAGNATEIKWTLPAGWSAGEINWPAPGRYLTQSAQFSLMNYVYEDEVFLPVEITAPASARPGESVTLTAAVSFLVCAEICVPEDALLTISLPVTAEPGPLDVKWGQKISDVLASIPKPGLVSAVFARKGQNLALALTGAPIAGAAAADTYFYPFKSTVLDPTATQTVERGPEGLTLSLTPGYDFKQGTAPTSLDGVLSIDGKAYEVSASEGVLPAGAAGLGPPVAAAGSSGGLGLAPAFLYALIGGLILNLMPCVFPILAMKAASFAGHGGEARGARMQGLAFMAGVLATFLGLAGALIAIRAGGAAIGWGFQLQSPPVVAGLVLLMLAVALNLSGLFEIGTSLQGAGTGLASRQGLAGAFFTGALAVVVAAPCTAPFMGPALGWALTQNAAAALTVFLGLGLGFGAPFTLAAFAPGLLSRLPRPGPWMDTFKKLMAFPMYGASAWLVWVLAQQAGNEALARVLAASVVLALALWLLGVAQAMAGQGRKPWVRGVVGAALLALAAVSVVWPSWEPAKGELTAEVWSPERVAALQAEGKPVFVNFTAAWCVTCQVNEKVAFASPAVAKAFEKSGMVYLKGDWTRKDAVIEAELARHGRAGVPLYLVYPARGGDPVVLPQLLTEGLVLDAIKAAGPPPSR